MNIPLLGDAGVEYHSPSKGKAMKKHLMDHTFPTSIDTMVE
jgi:hypothetical protein